MLVKCNMNWKQQYYGLRFAYEKYNIQFNDNVIKWMIENSFTYSN